MRPRWGLLWLLGAAAASCLLEGSRGSSPHTIRVSYTSATEDCPGLPFFSAEGYVDDQLITRYESRTRKMLPGVDWINILEKEDPKFYYGYTWILRRDQDNFQEDVQMLQKRYNQSGGFHIVQMMILCEVGEDGKRSGRWQYGYDGRNFLNYDIGTSSWSAVDKAAEGVMQIWDNETPGIKERFTDYLENTCLEWLHKNDRYGSKSFLRKEPPMVKLSSRMEPDGMETHVCQVYGFYPREIDAFWRRDGEVWLQDTLRASVAPNADGTYHYWLSVRIDPKERSRYRCHVEHDGLLEPLDMALKGPESSLWLIIGVVAGSIVVCAVVGILVLVCLKFKKGNDEPKSEPSRDRVPMASC